MSNDIFVDRTYLLTHVPLDLWLKAKERSRREKWTMRNLILSLLDDYGAGLVSPTKTPNPQAHWYLESPANARERSVVVVLYADENVQPFRATQAYETSGNLLLLDHFDQVVARFSTAQVATWFTEV